MQSFFSSTNSVIRWCLSWKTKAKWETWQKTFLFLSFQFCPGVILNLTLKTVVSYTGVSGGLNFVYLSANAPRPPRSAERRPRGSLRNPKVLTLELGREPYHSFQKASGCFESKCRRKFPFQRESKNSVWMRDLKILWGEVVGDDVVTRSRHPSPKIPTAHWQELQSCTVSPPPLAIIERGRWFDGKGGFAAFAHFTASPPIGYFTIWRYCRSLESLWAFTLHLMIGLHWHFKTFPRRKKTDELSLNLSILDK